jgi:hypothetical protein
MRKALLLVALTISLLLSACGKPTEVSNDMRRTVLIATTTLSSEKDERYSLLEPGEVERFLRDHPEAASEVPRIIENMMLSLEVERFLSEGYSLLEPGEVERYLRDYPENADRVPELIEATKGSLEVERFLRDHPEDAHLLRKLIEEFKVKASLESEASLKDESVPTLEDR